MTHRVYALLRGGSYTCEDLHKQVKWGGEKKRVRTPGGLEGLHSGGGGKSCHVVAEPRGTHTQRVNRLNTAMSTHSDRALGTEP